MLEAKTQNAISKHHRAAARHAVCVGALAFAIALPLGLVSQTVLSNLPSLVISMTMLLLVIGLGVVFDVVGVAITAANEVPLHASAAAGVFGARRAAWLVRHAHGTASFCNDVVGDVTGTLSGALGIAIVIQISAEAPDTTMILATVVMSSAIAALIVAGKAYGKVYAINHSTEVTLYTGRLLELIYRFGSMLRRHR